VSISDRNKLLAIKSPMSLINPTGIVDGSGTNATSQKIIDLSPDEATELLF
jgi:hypothetical protein